MSLTLLAIFLAPLYLKIVLDPKNSHKTFKNLSSSSETQITFSMVLLLLSVVILSSTGFKFGWDWQYLLAWLGAIIGVKGAVLLLFPEVMKSQLKRFTPGHMPALGFLGLLMTLALIYVDTQILL
jgi:hypothetical protein